ncbi:MAG: hypothetical protein FJ125_06775, partial [Deltaproteobacteria bacterium]|nr:hypothetical protein [Deltaproteobacteria bacterium]
MAGVRKEQDTTTTAKGAGRTERRVVCRQCARVNPPGSSSCIRCSASLPAPSGAERAAKPGGPPPAAPVRPQISLVQPREIPRSPSPAAPAPPPPASSPAAAPPPAPAPAPPPVSRPKLVTRVAEDGTLEMVYEVEAADVGSSPALPTAESVEPGMATRRLLGMPLPLLRRVGIIAGVVLALLVLVLVAWPGGGEDKAEEAASATNRAAPTEAAAPGSGPRRPKIPVLPPLPPPPAATKPGEDGARPGAAGAVGAALPRPAAPEDEEAKAEEAKAEEAKAEE